MFFTLGFPLKVPSRKKLIKARIGVSKTIYIDEKIPKFPLKIDLFDHKFGQNNFLGLLQYKTVQTS